ncbi:MAG: 4Fe-4S binding protein [Gammaproteobacteria bacterium]|nr:4Fe-4S binding protein [Gammaproteobacteria bacterium]
MSVVTEQAVSQNIRGERIARLGLFMRRHQGLIAGMQWAIVLCYLVMVVAPVFLPPPSAEARIWGSFTRFTQFMFWGVWWPFVLLSIMVFGRAWCGLLCPEGTVTEWVSQYGLGLGIPRWMKWPGWPFVTFMAIALYGQMISLHQYPRATLLILGGSTVAAVVIGLLYGRGKRVWCRHLCPVCGVFALLAKVAPVHFSVDRAAWDAAPSGTRTSLRHPVNCAPLINIRRMESAAACHMCGRCAGERGAVQLALRSPATEILAAATPETRRKTDSSDRWLAWLLVFGMIGAALGAFQWNVSPWFSAADRAAAVWLSAHGLSWLLRPSGYWWVLTYYPGNGHVFSWLDGGLLIAYVMAEALIVGGWVAGWMRLAAAVCGLPWWRIADVLIFFAGANLFVGSVLLAWSQDSGAVMLPHWAGVACLGLLVLAVLWGAVLAGRLARRRALAILTVLGAGALPLGAWAVEFFVWRTL